MNIGFLCEGQTEQKIVDAPKFKEFLKTLNINHQGTVNTKGNGQILPEHLPAHTKKLTQMGAWKIFIITDADKKTIKQVYEKICPDEQIHILIIAVKKIESWFLSNDDTLKKITGTTYSEYSERKKYLKGVEELSNPYNQLEEIFNEETDLIDTSKLAIANEFIKNDFDIQNSNCDSARYFVEKLNEIANSEPVSPIKKRKNQNRKGKIISPETK